MTLKSILLLLFAVVLTGASETARAQDSCRLILSVPRNDYANLSQISMSKELRDAILAVRAKVKARLGWLPQIQRWDLKYVESVRLYLPGVETTQANEIAYSGYRIEGTTLRMNKKTETREDYRENGLSVLMAAEILAANPEIDRIEIESLSETNLDLFLDSYEAKGKLKKAARSTAAYKRFAPFGFTKIKQVRFRPPTFNTQLIPGHTMAFDGETKIVLVRPDSSN